jgi:hypothetical protein
MKMIHHTTLAALVLLLLPGLPAKANLMEATDPRFGLNSLTIDTMTGLAWLDLTASAGLSYQQVLADTQPGGIFSGFRFATAPEVLNLYTSAGIPGIGYYPLSTPPILTLISLIGATGTINGEPGLLGLSATAASFDSQYAPAIYATGVSGIQEYWVNGGGYNSGGTSYGVTTSYPELGSWLVSSVPESSDASIYVLAAAGLIGFAFLQRPQRNAACASGDHRATSRSIATKRRY